MQKKIVVYSHNGHNSFRGNWDEELVNYLLCQGGNEVLHIRFPFGQESLKSIRLLFYRDGQKKIKESLIKFSQPEITSYFKDLFHGVLYGLRYSRNTDLFVGTNCLLVLVGLCLRKIGFVKKVVYVVIDYTPTRFSNRLINYFYYFLDRIACYYSDEVWPLNKKMLEGREKDGKINLNRVRFVEVPFGNNSLSFREADYNNFNKHRIVYFGGIIKNKGCELFVPLVKSLLASGLLDVELWIVGGGDIDYLKKEISDNNLDYCINVLGRIENQKDVDKILLTGGVAIAPYYPEDKNSFSYYSDPGKVKIYLGCGLPIVITGVPPIASSIMKNNAGLVADYSADDFSDKIMKILSNYSFYKINAIKFGKNFDWNNIFDRVSLLNKKIDK